MKILVTMKRVTDYERKVKIAPDGSKLITEGMNFAANPFDEVAVEEACTWSPSKREMLEASGYEVMMQSPDPLPPGASIHEGGTVRMGDDPKTSVLNGRASAWDVSNLYVTDCAAFTTAGSQNPVLTIKALNVRAAEDIVARMKRREL